jgi:phosphotransacetylase
MSGRAQLLERMRARQPRIALVASEAHPGVRAAAERIQGEGLGTTVLIGAGGLRPSDDPRLSSVANLLRERAPNQVRDGIHALDLAADPLLFAAGLAALGQVDICCAPPGAAAEGVEQAVGWLQAFGADWPALGSIGYLLTEDDRWWATATPAGDAAVDPKVLARLALAAANHRARAMDEGPRVAFFAAPRLNGEATPIDQALVEFHTLAPGIGAQVDRSAVAAARTRGHPTVLVFPDRVASHLVARFLRELGRSRVLGPLYPGPDRAFAGLAEEADADDILAVAAILAAGLAGL